MRVTDIDLFTNDTEAINFALYYTGDQKKYIVRTIIGLDAEEIIPKFYGMGLVSKPRYYDFGLKSRTIVIRVVLNPRFRLEESYSEIRDELYRAISSSRTGLVTLHFYSGGTTVARIQGFITKFEVPHFTQLPEVQLTIRCDDPMFRAINPVRLESTEIPEGNPVIVADSISTAPHGLAMVINVTATIASLTIQDVPTTPEWKFKVIPAGGFVSGDVIYLSSEYSNKYLYMIRSSTRTDLMDKIEPTSIWPVIFPGANQFHFVEIAETNFNGIEYYAAYWGV